MKFFSCRVKIAVKRVCCKVVVASFAVHREIKTLLLIASYQSINRWLDGSISQSVSQLINQVRPSVRPLVSPLVSKVSQTDSAVSQFQDEAPELCTFFCQSFFKNCLQIKQHLTQTLQTSTLFSQDGNVGITGIFKHTK